MKNFLNKLRSINSNLLETCKESIVDDIHQIYRENIRTIDRLFTEQKKDYRPFETYGVTSNAGKSKRRSGHRRKSSRRQKRSDDYESLSGDEHPSHHLSFDTRPHTKDLYNEKNIRELVNTVRREIGELIDEDRKPMKKKTVTFDVAINQNFSNNRNINSSAVKKKKKTQRKKKSKKSSRSQRKKKKKPKKKSKKSSRTQRKKKKKPKKISKKGSRSQRKKKKQPKKISKKSSRSQGKKKTKSKTGIKTRKPKSKKHRHTTKQKKQRIKKEPVKWSEPVEPTPEIRSVDQSNNCCCNFLHYSLRQLMRDTEQMKQFALNTSMIGLDPSKLRDPTNTLCPALCIPMYNCESIRDQRFPSGPTFTTVSKAELTQPDTSSVSPQTNSMIIQTINTQRGPIQIRLDPHSFGLAPFFSDQYETFIKGPSNSIFFTSYLHTYHP